MTHAAHDHGLGDGLGVGVGLIVMWGAVPVCRLVAELTETTTGTSPVLTVAGKVMSSSSNPGWSVAMFFEVIIAVVPMVAVIPPGILFLTPVRWISSTVATRVPVPSSDVILNGSPRHPGVAGLVTLHTTARPRAPFVLEKISGCAATITTNPRITVPLLLITTG